MEQAGETADAIWHNCINLSLSLPQELVKHLFKFSLFSCKRNFDLIRFFSVFLSFNPCRGWQNIKTFKSPSSIPPPSYCQPVMCFLFWFCVCFCCGLILRAAFNCDKCGNETKTSQGTNQYWTARTIHPGRWSVTKHDSIQASRFAIITIADSDARSNYKGKFLSLILPVTNHFAQCKFIISSQ